MLLATLRREAYEIGQESDLSREAIIHRAEYGLVRDPFRHDVRFPMDGVSYLICHFFEMQSGVHAKTSVHSRRFDAATELGVGNGCSKPVLLSGHN
jgi:hypothetical protein